MSVKAMDLANKLVQSSALLYYGTPNEVTSFDTAVVSDILKGKTMSAFRIPFQDMPWEQLRPDVKQKLYCEGSRQIRIVEFDTSNGPEHWCETGHIGFVLKGALRIDFNGQIVTFGPGDGLFIPSGPAHQHRAVEIERGTQLLMIEDVEGRG